MNASLSTLTIGTLTLSPTFSGSWLWYTSSTTEASSEVTATPDDGTATVVIKLDTVVDPDGTVTWAEGANTLTIEVTVGDETAIYTVWVTKSTE